MKSVPLPDRSHASLAPYLPVKEVGYHLWWMLLFVTVAIVGSVLLCEQLNVIDTTPLMQLIGLFMVIPGVIGTASVAVTLLWCFPECAGSLTKWWRAYRARNVKGYLLRCALVDGHVLWCVEEENDLYGFLREHPKVNVTIVTNLATGHSDFDASTSASRDYGVWMTDWSIRLLNLDEPHSVVVELSDRFGAKVRLTERDVLDLFERAVSGTDNERDYLSRHDSIAQLVHGLFFRLDFALNALDKEKEQRDLAVQDLVQAARRIRDTKRFVLSKEGGAVGDWLDEQVAKHHAVRPIPGHA